MRKWLVVTLGGLALSCSEAGLKNGLEQHGLPASPDATCQLAKTHAGPYMKVVYRFASDTGLTGADVLTDAILSGSDATSAAIPSDSADDAGPSDGVTQSGQDAGRGVSGPETSSPTTLTHEWKNKDIVAIYRYLDRHCRDWVMTSIMEKRDPLPEDEDNPPWNWKLVFHDGREVENVESECIACHKNCTDPHGYCGTYPTD